MSLSSETTDRAMMARCIELSAVAVKEGEYPFGSLITLDGRIIAEATNRTMRDNDVSRHAEVIALSQAQQAVGRAELHRATLYSNVEPCAMCSYCIREAWVGRVVYALTSPIMGGATKWNILRDTDISSRVPIFAPAPEVVSGVLAAEVQELMARVEPPGVGDGADARRVDGSGGEGGASASIGPSSKVGMASRDLRFYEAVEKG